MRKDRVRFVRLYALGDRDGMYCLEVLIYEFCCRGIVIVVFNDTATTEIYTLSLHDALPIFGSIMWR